MPVNIWLFYNFHYICNDSFTAHRGFTIHSPKIPKITNFAHHRH
jgi:hypothetical protein